MLVKWLSKLRDMTRRNLQGWERGRLRIYMSLLCLRRDREKVVMRRVKGRRGRRFQERKKIIPCLLRMNFFRKRSCWLRMNFTSKKSWNKSMIKKNKTTKMSMKKRKFIRKVISKTWLKRCIIMIQSLKIQKLILSLRLSHHFSNYKKPQQTPKNQ